MDRGLCVERGFPVFAEYPPQRRQLPVEHPPLEVVPRAELARQLLLHPARRGERAFPDAPHHGVLGILWPILIDELDVTIFDLVREILVAVVGVPVRIVSSAANEQVG
jgi:hypothetical protein